MKVRLITALVIATTASTLAPARSQAAVLGGGLLAINIRLGGLADEGSRGAAVAMLLAGAALAVSGAASNNHGLQIAGLVLSADEASNPIEQLRNGLGVDAPEAKEFAQLIAQKMAAGDFEMIEGAPVVHIDAATVGRVLEQAGYDATADAAKIQAVAKILE